MKHQELLNRIHEISEVYILAQLSQVTNYDVVAQTMWQLANDLYDELAIESDGDVMTKEEWIQCQEDSIAI